MSNIPKMNRPRSILLRPQKVVAAAWSDIENAVRFAEQVSRTLIPDFWKIHNESNKAGARFDVYSIHFNLNDSHPIYSISKNHNFDFEYVAYSNDDLWMESPIRRDLPEPPADLWLSIRRLGVNHFENAN